MKLSLLDENLKCKEFEIDFTREDIGDIYPSDDYYSVYINTSKNSELYETINKLMSINLGYDEPAERYHFYFDINARIEDPLEIKLMWLGNFDDDAEYEEVWCEMTVFEESLLIEMCCSNTDCSPDDF